MGDHTTRTHCEQSVENRRRGWREWGAGERELASTSKRASELARFTRATSKGAEMLEALL